MTQKGFSVLILVIAISLLFALTSGGILLYKNNFAKVVPDQPITSTNKLVNNPSPSSKQPYLTEKNDPIASTPSAEVIKNGTEVKFTGIISSTSDECWVDGSCSLTVDGKTIFVAGGLTPDVENPTPKGQLIGYNYSEATTRYIGKKAEVYVKVLSNNFFTIDGNKNYYVKVLEN